MTVFYLEEDWRGAQTWAACQRELRARGEVLDWHAYIPPPVPDEQNLAMAPLFVRSLHYQMDPKTGALSFGHDLEDPEEFKPLKSLFGAKPPGLIPGGWERARHTDLTAYQRYYRDKSGLPHADQPQIPALDVLLALSSAKCVLDELTAAASQRPLTRFPVTWDADDPLTTALPQYNTEQILVKVLCLRASANLAADHPEEALDDVELCQRLCGDMSRDHVLIAHLVQITCIGMTLNPIWEGLADRRWNATQLASLQEKFGRFDLLVDATAAHQGERAYFLRILDFAEQHRDLSKWINALQSASGESPSQIDLRLRIAYAVAPRGWFDLDKAIYARHMQEYYIDVIDPRAHRLTVQTPGTAQRATAVQPLTSVLTFLMLPVYDSVERRTAWVQTGVDEAITACALERFYLDHRKYPAGLGELVPGYLPHLPTDVVDGAPLRYHLTPDGRYQLYGVGWNQRDDGGQVAWTASKAPDIGRGDWVWQYAEPPESVSKK